VCGHLGKTSGHPQFLLKVLKLKLEQKRGREEEI
jgi:hypothetical protein